ncbi:MAG: hypothetical protein WAM60_26155, partial [Candidatus Promineifilaceae bacterium]
MELLVNHQAYKKPTTDPGTLADIVKLCRPYLPPDLIAPQSFVEHFVAARQLPVYFSGRFGFELYLNDESNTAGMSYCVETGTNGWRYLSGGSTQSQSPLFDLSAWQRIRHFCQTADKGRDWIYPALEGIWFEFDVDADERPV